jgi:hypothetical protein
VDTVAAHALAAAAAAAALVVAVEHDRAKNPRLHQP